MPTVEPGGTPAGAYPLTVDDRELARLDRQGRVLAPATRFVLEGAGLRPGMRVLDLGSGAGDVALLAADIVGRTGRVVGVDRSPEAVAGATMRVAGADNVAFVVRELHEGCADLGPFDAVVGRLVLMYAPDPSVLLRRQAEALAPGGIVAVLELDVGSCRSLPEVPLVRWMAGLVGEAFRRAGTDPELGPRLWPTLADAGLTPRGMVAVQPHFGPDDADAAWLLTGVLRSAAAVVERTGVAAAEDLGLDTFEDRLRAELSAVRAVVAYPTFYGAWATA